MDLCSRRIGRVGDGRPPFGPEVGRRLALGDWRLARAGGRGRACCTTATAALQYTFAATTRAGAGRAAAGPGHVLDEAGTGDLLYDQNAADWRAFWGDG